MQLYNEDCLEGMKRLEDNSVDCIISDLPYNLTDCAWDKSVIDLPAMWEQFKRILKPYNSAVLFASGKSAYKLIASNYDWYKYKWIWVKNAPTMFVHAKNAPMRKYEEILIFSDGVINHKTVSTRRMKYNPQGLIDYEMLKSEVGKDKPSQLRTGGRGKYKSNVGKETATQVCGGRFKSGKNATKTQIHNPHPENTYLQTQTNYPSDVLEEKKFRGVYADCGSKMGHCERRNSNGSASVVGERPSRAYGSYYLQEQTGYPSDVLYCDVEPSNKKLHPTQKPVPLLEYLIKTYTNEGELVLDATMGSGSTGVACVNTGRKLIGFETEKNFFEIAGRRIAEAEAKKAQSLF